MAYTTAAKLRAYLGVDSNADDTLLGELISAAQNEIERTTLTVFDASSTSTMYFDPVRDVTGRTLWLHRWCCGITSITNGDGTALDASEYITRPVNETPFSRITILGTSTNRWTWSTDPENAIAIVGNWGWSETVPAEIELATRLLAAYWYRMAEGSTGNVGFISDGDPSRVDSYVRWPAQVKRIVEAKRVPVW